jgi:hypothetical protein
MNFAKNFCLHALLILLIFGHTRCVPLLVGAAAGAGGMSYAKGALSKNFEANVEKTHKATLKALKGLKLFIKSEELNKHDAMVKAEFEDGEEAKVFIDAVTEHVSKVTIRVGFMGDRDASQVILNAIQKQL